MKSFLILLWIGVCISVALGTLILVGGMSTAKGAPQEAVVCCLALCFAVLPYIFTRAVEGIAISEAMQRITHIDDIPGQGIVLTPSREPYNYEKTGGRKDEGTITSLKL